MQGAGAMAAGVLEDQVAVASTGVIGVPLDADKVIRGHRRRPRASCAADGDGDFGAAIRTTDAFAKKRRARGRAALGHRAADARRPRARG